MNSLDRSSLTPAAGRGRWLERGLWAALVLACAVALSPNTVDPDLWGHWQYAEDVLADGYLHPTATHTFTAQGYRWVNHENLAELATALVYRVGGVHGLLIGKCLLGLGVMLLMFRAAQRAGVSLVVQCGFFLIVATTLSAFWAIRPQLASFVGMALMVAVLDRAFRDWSATHRVDRRWLWALPPLFVFWANAHGGFVAGYCLLIAYLGCRGLEALYRCGLRTASRQWGVFALAASLTGGALLVTPYGFELLFRLVRKLRYPRPEIIEWAPPAWGDAFFLPMLLLFAAILIGWLLTTKRRDWTHVTLIALCMWQALVHSRHLPFVAILAGFWLPVHVQSAFDRFRPQRASETDSVWGQRAVGLGLALAMLLLVGKLATRLYDLPVEKNKYPVAALQYMADHQLDGKLVVSFNWAQYALTALEPTTQVAFDGRFRTCYPQEVIDMHFDFLIGDVPGQRYRSPKSGAIDGRRVLDYFDPDLVLLDRKFAQSVKVMQSQDDFTLLYQDGVAQIWGRRARFDDPAAPSYFAQSQRSISDAAQAGSVTWPALPERGSSRALVQGDAPRDVAPPIIFSGDRS